MAYARSGGSIMTAVASIAVAVSALKPADFGGLEANPESTAFAALFASVGEQSLRSPAPQHVLPPASIGRLPDPSGKFVPITVPPTTPPTDLKTAQPNKNLLPSLSLPQVSSNGAAESRLPPGDEFTADLVRERFFAATPRSLQPGPADFAEGQSLRDALDARLEPASPIANRATPISILAPPLVHAASASAPVAVVDAPLPVHHPRFAEALTQQVSVMARDGIQQARISLNPAELGPVELRVVVRNDEASVQLAAHTAAVREILEDALPRLREQFEQSGMRLSDSSVFQQLPQQKGGETHAGTSERESESAELSPLEAFEQLEATTATATTGMIDAYI